MLTMRCGRWSFVVVAVLGLLNWSRAADAASTADTATNNDAASDDIVSLAAYNVKADRIEDFGLRVRSASRGDYPKNAVSALAGRYVPIIFAVLPNTAAAKAGLQPGERILKSDGKSLVGGIMTSVYLKKWRELQKQKWAEVAAGKTNVTWTLEVEAPLTKAIRTVKLIVPTTPPHWGASRWRAPEGRDSSGVSESGPLAERSREMIEHGIWALVDERFARALGEDFRRGIGSDAMSGREPSGYGWSFESKGGTHQMLVTRFRGRTEIVFHARSPVSGLQYYLTSPSGTLERAWHRPPTGKESDLSLEEARAGFEHELDFWTTKVVCGTGRWPFEIKPGFDANAIFASLAPKGAKLADEALRPPVLEAFQKLPLATDAQRALFMAAYEKLGVDQERWAYTETSRGLEDKRVFVTRVDPSKSEAERCVLVSIDGKKPKPADVQRWREDGGDAPKPFGELPSLTELVNVQEVRVWKEDVASIVFELPLQGGEFSSDTFQALFRVNKTLRAFEDVTVKLREALRVNGALKVTDGGLEARFQVFDPTLAPQPVFLKAGGGVRVLLVKFSRAFEATRADFKRVEPFVVPAGVEK